MFKELRRKDRKMDEKRTKSILSSGEYGVLSMVSINGYGYGVPINYVLYKDAIYFHCACEGSKIDDMKANNRVSFCVIGSAEPVPKEFTTKYESVIVFGKASEVEGLEKEEAFIALVDRFCHDFLAEGIESIRKNISATKIIRIDIEHITGKARA